jgi:tellurite resistance protein TerC
VEWISQHKQAFLWIGFSILVLGALVVDLGLFHRKAHVVKAREALAWSVVWIVLALVFNAGVWWFLGRGKAEEFLAGYILEKSLSVDNLFVFVVIFSYFAVPAQYESRILMWGIIGAFIMRAIFIFVGAALLKQFGWLMVGFGLFLLFTGFKLLVKKDEQIEPDKNPVVRLFKRFFPVGDKLDGQRFFTTVDGRRVATPLFIVLLVVESSDVIFAVDSIPAIFAVTKDPFIVFTSNVFAILGLRSLYFLLARMMNLFRFLKFGLVLILWFVGVKMIIVYAHERHWIGWHIPTVVSLAVIGGILGLSVALSLLLAEKPKYADGEAPEGPSEKPPSTPS